MLLASKYEEIWAPEVRDFVYISDKAYTREQILSMEKDLAISYVLMLIPVKRFGTIARSKELSPPAQLTQKVGF